MHRPKAVARAPVTNQQVLREADVEQVIGIIPLARGGILSIEYYASLPNRDGSRDLELVLIVACNSIHSAEVWSQDQQFVCGTHGFPAPRQLDLAVRVLVSHGHA